MHLLVKRRLLVGVRPYAGGLANLAEALGTWKASKTGKRAGPAARFPRFKTKRGTWSYGITTGAFGLSDADRRHVKLPRIGLVRTHESTRKLALHLERGTGRTLTATVSFRRGRWQVSFTCQIQKQEPAPATAGGTVGVDLGVKSLAILSTGETIDNPKHLAAAQRELRRLQRQAARRWTPGRKPSEQSQRWHATQDRIRRLHSYVASARADGLHQLSTRLVAEFDTVVVEDLHVSGMLRNRTLSRAVADVGTGELRRQIDYKTTWHGRTLVTASRWYPSSKTCSGCGVAKAKLRLSERVFHCDNEACGLVLDRDYNAACNLAALVREVDPSPKSYAGTLNEPDGNPGKTSHAGMGYRHGKTENRETVKAA